MKIKNSWDLQPNESLYTKKEQRKIKLVYQKKHKIKNQFYCWCGKYHSWNELGKKH